MDIGTSYGLAFASGINAYLPLLSFALAARFFHLYKVNPNFSYITQDWFLIGLAILALADIFADKIPVLDHLWDAIHTVLRPIAGALVVAASGQAIPGPGLVTALAAGGAVAGATHATKATTRLASTTMTLGLGNLFLSLGEDVIMVTSVLLSLLAPGLMVIVLALVLVLFLLLLPVIGRCLRQVRQGQRVRANAQGMSMRA
jgi:energy-coupling factor transporter transmembrane protein EcfT